MALFKPLKGSRASLDAQPLHDGYAYFCIDDGTFHIDVTDASGVLKRKQINAQEAEKLTGYDIATILNSSDSEIPTSKAVLDVIEEAKADADKKDIAVLVEAQKGIAAVSELVGDTSVSDQISIAISGIGAVSYNQQTLTDDQKIQARANINAAEVQIITPDSSETLSTLKIQKLSQEAYDQMDENGTLDKNVLYLTPEESILPEITEADNGKVLMVVNGKLQLVSLNLSIDANGVVSI